MTHLDSPTVPSARLSTPSKLRGFRAAAISVGSLVRVQKESISMNARRPAAIPSWAVGVLAAAARGSGRFFFRVFPESARPPLQCGSRRGPIGQVLIAPDSRRTGSRLREGNAESENNEATANDGAPV